MATARKLSAYPTEYGQLFDIASREKVVLEFSSNSAAQSMRNALYTYRSVLYKEPTEKLAQGRAQNVRLRIAEEKIIATPIIREDTNSTSRL